MGKKKWARKTSLKRPSSPPPEEEIEEPTTDVRPPSPQPQQQPPTPQEAPMFSLDALAAYLKQSDPNRDWAATLASFGLLGDGASVVGGVPVVPSPTPDIPATIIPSTTAQTISTPAPEKSSPTEETQNEPLLVTPLSADQETEEKESEEGEERLEETPVADPIPAGGERGEIDLNETARKQGLMTDAEFQSLLDEVNREEEETAEMAEGLDLASQAQEEPELNSSEPEAGEGDERAQEKDAEITTKGQRSVAPPVIKPEVVKRKLVLKDDPKGERQRPTRVSQRCLGRWTSSKAGANTAADAVEISSEDERATPTKPGEEPLSATSLEDTSTATRMASPTPDVQEEETTEMAEGLDLASRVARAGIPIDNDTIFCMVTKPTAPKEPSSSAEKKLEVDEDEDRYRQERKRKGKAPIKAKQSSKKQRTVNTGVVIREPEQRRPQARLETSDSEYSSSDEPDSGSDVSLEEEEYHEQQLPNDHRELAHPPVERVEYKRWRVELTDELMEDMKHYNTRKLQDAFDDKEDGSKQVKCGKVLHFPSLDELSVRESFLSYIRALGFEWLLENRDPGIPVRLAKEFFTTFRFKVTTDLDEVSISFRVFGRELSMSLIKWTVRLGMCNLEEAIGPEWRSRERGIPRRHVEFNPQAAWEELTHPAAGQFASTLSRSIHFNNPTLRLVQLYLDFNLLGQTNSAVRTSMAELYLLWCSLHGRRVHLGFWTAYQCHLIATHPARNMSICHILGAFVRNNITAVETEDLSPMFMVDPPGLFDTPFFNRTNTIYYREGVPQFYAMGEEAIPAGRAQPPQAGQNMRAQERRQTELEQAVVTLAAENKETRAQLTRMANMLEEMFKHFGKKKETDGAGMSGPEKEGTDIPEEPEEDSLESTEEEPEELPAPNPAPRRSRRNM